MRHLGALSRSLRGLGPNDWLPALVLAVAQPTLTAVLDGHRGIHAHLKATSPLDPWAYLLLTLAGLVLVWHRSHPAATLAAVFAIVELYLGLGYLGGPIWFALIFAFVSCVMRGWRPAAYLLLAAGYGAAWISSVHTPPELSTRMGVLAWLIVLAAYGEIVRARRRFREVESARKAEAQAMVEEAQRHRAGEERLRIAQDLHDVLAHHISLITVQAGVGLELFDRRPQQARAALAAVKEAGNTALGELRSVLDILRDPKLTAPRVPAPLLTRAADFTALVDGARGAGLDVRLARNANRTGAGSSVDVNGRRQGRAVTQALPSVHRLTSTAGLAMAAPRTATEPSGLAGTVAGTVAVAEAAEPAQAPGPATAVDAEQAVGLSVAVSSCDASGPGEIHGAPVAGLSPATGAEPDLPGSHLEHELSLGLDLGAGLGLPVLVDQAAYRILQESLTNAVRHAGPGTAVTIAIAIERGELTLVVVDDGRGGSAGVTSGGNGIAGMRERAAALGGSLSAGSRPGGGFSVRARLPLAADGRGRTS
ncbi:MAG TPA: histidine kinase [Actinocrinis sp.]|jgi:signal transduction histidine kinase